MRQIISFIVMTMFIVCFSQSSFAQSDKKYAKTMEKVYKSKTKELKKQKWQVSGSSLTLEAAIMKHLRAINSDDKNRRRNPKSLTSREDFNK